MAGVRVAAEVLAATACILRVNSKSGRRRTSARTSAVTRGRQSRFEQILDELRHKLALQYLKSKKGLGQRDGVPGGVLGSGRVLTRVQALDRDQSSRGARETRWRVVRCTVGHSNLTAHLDRIASHRIAWATLSGLRRLQFDSAFTLTVARAR